LIGLARFEFIGHNVGMAIELPDEMMAKWPPEAQAVVRLLSARVAELEVQVAELRGQVAELRGKTPQNSSQPPSTTHPHAKSPSVKPKSKRSRGDRSVEKSQPAASARNRIVRAAELSLAYASGWDGGPILQ